MSIQNHQNIVDAFIKELPRWVEIDMRPVRNGMNIILYRRHGFLWLNKQRVGNLVVKANSEMSVFMPNCSQADYTGYDLDITIVWLKKYCGWINDLMVIKRNYGHVDIFPTSEFEYDFYLLIASTAVYHAKDGYLYSGQEYNTVKDLLKALAYKSKS